MRTFSPYHPECPAPDAEWGDPVPVLQNTDKSSSATGIACPRDVGYSCVRCDSPAACVLMQPPPAGFLAAIAQARGEGPSQLLRVPGT